MNEVFGHGAGKWMLVSITVFFAIAALWVLMNLRYVGAGIAAANTIQVSGHGQVDEAPNLATFTFSVVSDKATVAQAQADATSKQNALSAYLTQAGIADKDIRTSGYSIYPQYEYQQAACPQGSGYCPPGKQVLTGYEVRQMTTVKVRDLGKAGDLLAGVGGKGATEVSSLTFTFDDPNAPQSDARAAAIADAKAKAQVLAGQLGVSLVRIVSFSESNSSPRPMAVYEAATAYGKGGVASAPAISPGTNTVGDDVTVTYEIR
jgi:uncharacterized protein YggE